MGNRQISGLVSITVYTRGFAPRHWVCGIIEQQSGAFGNNNQLALLNPLGANSEADVLVSQLSMSPLRMQAGWEGVRLSGVFDGIHAFQARLNTRRSVGGDGGHASIGNTWNATFRGRDGQLHVLSIKFEVRLARQRSIPARAVCSSLLVSCSLRHSLFCSLVRVSMQPGELVLPFDGTAVAM